MGLSPRRIRRRFSSLCLVILLIMGWTRRSDSEPNSRLTSLIQQSPIGEASQARQHAGVYQVLPSGLPATSLLNSHSFNRTVNHTSQSYNDSSFNSNISSDGDDSHGPSESFDERDLPVRGAPGLFSSSPALEIPDLSSVPDVQSPPAIPPATEPRSPLPGAFPHLMEALYAELESVARLLANQAPESRSPDDLGVIMHLIRASSDFRARLQHSTPQAGGHGQEISSMHSPTPYSCQCGRTHAPMPTFPREAPCYDPYCNFPLSEYGPHSESIYIPLAPPEPYRSPNNVGIPYHAAYPHTSHDENRKHGPNQPESVGRFKHTQFWKVLFRRRVRTTTFVAPYECYDPPVLCAHSWT